MQIETEPHLSLLLLLHTECVGLLRGSDIAFRFFPSCPDARANVSVFISDHKLAGRISSKDRFDRRLHPTVGCPPQQPRVNPRPFTSQDPVF